MNPAQLSIIKRLQGMLGQRNPNTPNDEHSSGLDDGRVAITRPPAPPNPPISSGGSFINQLLAAGSQGVQGSPTLTASINAMPNLQMVTSKSANPSIGECYYDVHNGGQYVWDGSQWMQISGRPNMEPLEPATPVQPEYSDPELLEFNTIMNDLTLLSFNHTWTTEKALVLANKVRTKVLQFTNVNPMFDVDTSFSIMQKIDEHLEVIRNNNGDTNPNAMVV